MQFKRKPYGSSGFAGLLAAVGCCALLPAQATTRLVTQVVDDRVSVELEGNTRPEAVAENDLGPVDDLRVLDHVQLLLRRPATSQDALDRLVEDLHDPASSKFHHWLSSAELAQFSPDEDDAAQVADWLRRHGLTVNGTVLHGMVIDFTGTVKQIRSAFQAPIHRIRADGVEHIANMSNPRVPEALAEAVEGVVSLHDFRLKPQFKIKPEYTFTNTSGSTELNVVPADLATIYNLNPLFKAGITGKGQQIVVVEDTDVYSEADWLKFRSTFGLSKYTGGSFSQVHPAPRSGANNCTDPGAIKGVEGEATLDAQWASAAAPDAAIVVATCKDSATTPGNLIAVENLVGGTKPPAIISMSYGECETLLGATMNAAVKTMYQHGVAQGTSIYVSAGDGASAICDQFKAYASHGVTVNGMASTIYNVAVGGTDFGDTYAKTNWTYWNKTNGTTYGSAKSYVNEIPWNDSCASVLIANYVGFGETYGPSGFCAAVPSYGVSAEKTFYTVAGGAGGPSGCATGAAAKTGVVGGTCKGTPKPSWQSVYGNPADKVRDLPDVSLFSASGTWGHAYLYCDSDSADPGETCTGTAPKGWSQAGGTSFAAPIWAGFQALVNQKRGARQGNPNPVLYSLAKSEYGTKGSTACNSSLGNKVAGTCVFYDVTQGDNDVNCATSKSPAGTFNCYFDGARMGVLSTSNTAYDKAYGTNVGWDFATGIGTVNVTNLVNSW